MLGKHKGQELVKGGTYVNYKTGEFASFGKEGGVLPGEYETRYIDIPIPLMLVFGPLLGLAFILFLPAAGLAVLTMFIVKALMGSLAGIKGEAIKTALPSAAGVSFLQGSGKAGDEERAVRDLEERADEVEGLIIELEEEIRQRREGNNN